MNIRKSLVAGMLACTMLFAATACGKAPESEKAPKGQKTSENGQAAETAKDKKFRVVVMPKVVGIDYYNAVKKGVDLADQELDNVEVTWMGPTEAKVEKQIEMLETVIPTKPDVIAVAANDPDAIEPVLKKAKEKGIKVISWDGDAKTRDFFVNLVDYDAFGSALAESMVAQVGEKADIAIVTTTFTAPNQVLWIEAIKKTLADKYPEVKILDTRPAGEDTQKAFQITQDYLKTMPTLKGIIALGAPNLPGAVDAVKQAGMTDKIAVVGNATPNMMKNYLKEGLIKNVLLWNAPDHGYLTVYSALQLLTEGVEADKPFKAGSLGEFTPAKDDISLQIALPIKEFTKDNVDQFDF
ncbi:substrate-binding domain-containing protein [Petroclostridium sp. X23]|uniref:substrate-binding domain-containing protein n=1 Tax=Petroclostridium sp. X23 TaxID=3045146 RepID=UPI0024ADEB15|nr:substrate-binding domain-containing protein [Petroclostridium sp. X23]WHH57275.1 substrate-binding domain-containing protein [Petroclostridium sp. X23]